MAMTRRQLLAQAGAGLGLALAAPPRRGCAARPPAVSPADWQGVLHAARQEGEVVFYSSGVARTEEPLMKEFERQTGIRVQYSRPGGGEVVVRKFQTELEAGRVLADVCGLTDKALGLHAEQQGWTTEVAVPNVAGIVPTLPITSAHILPTGFFGLPIVYNRDLVREADAPKSYRDVADPRFRDKVVLGGPENAASTTLLIKGWLELYGWEFVEKLRAINTSETRLQTEAIQAVARGEKLVTVVAQAFAYLLLKQKAPLAVVWPSEGVVMAEMTMFVPRKAPHPNAARVFANHVLSPEYQTQTFPKVGAYGAVQGVPPPDLFPPLSALKIHPTRLDELLAQRAGILERWRRIMG